jgi:hypothetical protein
MASVREHYDVHLGPIYGWMLGDFSTAKEAARTELQAVGLYEGAGVRPLISERALVPTLSRWRRRGTP